ncbi:cytoplasmic dynein 2 intermediate chain 1-like [Lycorma delicatula]|uniref:cytoplasmic dynein 2 intermediate chain 1-like n=1 Tax=Lycorma delicatula TaxID=130591 RepID=UPI003F5120F7
MKIHLCMLKIQSAEYFLEEKNNFLNKCVLKPFSENVVTAEPSPDGNPMFLVGTNGGRVRLYLNRFEFPLVDVAGTVANPGPAIISLQWSLHRAGVFFILDENSCLHIWDLCKSDIFPLFSVPMNNALVSTIQISPHKETQFLAIGTDKGAVEIHKLTSELGQQSIEIQKKEK